MGAGSSDAKVVVHHTEYTAGQTTGGLSVLFTTLCIVDLFGVFPIVALPQSVIACGIYGVPLVLGVFMLQLYTAVLLGRSWLLAQTLAPCIREKSRFPYAAVAELAFGTHARRLVTFLINATIFGAGVPNFIFAAQSMQLFWWKISGGAIGVSYCVWMVLVGLLLCPVMWLGSPKDMKFPKDPNNQHWINVTGRKFRSLKNNVPTTLEQLYSILRNYVGTQLFSNISYHQIVLYSTEKHITDFTKAIKEK